MRRIAIGNWKRAGRDTHTAYQMTFLTLFCEPIMTSKTRNNRSSSEANFVKVARKRGLQYDYTSGRGKTASAPLQELLEPFAQTVKSAQNSQDR